MNQANMLCRNHNLQVDIVGWHGDGTHRRPRLSCGCIPHKRECPGDEALFGTAALPPELERLPVEMETSQMDPQALERRIRELIDDALKHADDRPQEVIE